MGYETLKNILDYNKEQEELGKLEKRNPTVCPDCAWHLDVNDKGYRSCPICGRVWR